MPLYRARRKLYIDGVIRNVGDEFEYSGPSRPESHMVEIESATKDLGPAGLTGPRARVAPGHPEVADRGSTLAREPDLSDPRDSNLRGADRRMFDDLMS